MGFNVQIGDILATVRGQQQHTHLLLLLLEVWSKSPTLEVIEAAVWQRHIEGGGGGKTQNDLSRRWPVI